MLVSWCDVPSRAQQHRSAASAHQDNTKTSDDTIQALVLDLLFFLGATNISIKMKNPECVPLYRLAGQNKIMNVHNINSLFGMGSTCSTARGEVHLQSSFISIWYVYEKRLFHILYVIIPQLMAMQMESHHHQDTQHTHRCGKKMGM
jgi:hypothetical protein